MAFASCSKDDGASFKYDMDLLYGKWTSTAIKSSEKWIDLPQGSNLAFSATFKSNGTYSADGSFGVGSGAYKATGDTIITYYRKNGVRPLQNTVDRQ